MDHTPIDSVQEPLDAQITDGLNADGLHDETAPPTISVNAAKLRLAAVVVCSMILLGVILLALGRPDWLVVALLCGVATAVLTVLGQFAAIVVPAEMSDQARTWFWGATPMAIVAIIILGKTSFTPAMFTPDALAERLTLAEIDDHACDLAGRAFRSSGYLKMIEPWDYDVTALYLHDGYEESWVSVLTANNNITEQITTGQWVEFVATIDNQRMRDACDVIASKVKLIPAPADYQPPDPDEYDEWE